MGGGNLLSGKWLGFLNPSLSQWGAYPHPKMSLLYTIQTLTVSLYHNSISKISISCCSPSWFCCYAMCAPLLSSLKSISFAKTRKIFRKRAFLPLSFSTFWKAYLIEGGGRTDDFQIHVLSCVKNWVCLKIYEPVYGGQSGSDGGGGKVEANSPPFIHKFTQSSHRLPACPLSKKDSAA